MVRLDLSEDEKNKLLHALTLYLSNLRLEIADTDDNSFYKNDLKIEEEILNSILRRLEEESREIILV